MSATKARRTAVPAEEQVKEDAHCQREVLCLACRPQEPGRQVNAVPAAPLFKQRLHYWAGVPGVLLCYQYGEERREERGERREEKRKEKRGKLEKTDQGEESWALRKQMPGRSSVQAGMQQWGAPKTVNMK